MYTDDTLQIGLIYEILYQGINYEDTILFKVLGKEDYLPIACKEDNAGWVSYRWQRFFQHGRILSLKIVPPEDLPLYLGWKRVYPGFFQQLI